MSLGSLTTPSPRRVRGRSVPAGVVVGLGATSWLALRLSAPAAAYPAAVVGWLMLVLLLATVAATVSATRGWAWCDSAAAGAALAAAVGLLLLLPWLDTQTFGLLALLRAYALLVGWLGLLLACGMALRPWPAARACGLLATSAVGMLALSVVITPAVRSVGPSARHGLLVLTAYASPPLALLAALRPDVAFSWPQQPVMYALSPVGQDYPLPPGAWWPLPLACGLLAALLLRRAPRGPVFPSTPS